MDFDNKVISFFKDKTGLKDINSHTNISSHEYGIFDLDAEFIMNSFFEKFKVDSLNFCVDDYFQYPNYSWRSLVFIRLFFDKVQHPLKPALTIKYLIEVGKRKVWFDPS